MRKWSCYHYFEIIILMKKSPFLSTVHGARSFSNTVSVSLLVMWSLLLSGRLVAQAWGRVKQEMQDCIWSKQLPFPGYASLSKPSFIEWLRVLYREWFFKETDLGLMEWFVKPGGKIFAAVQQDNAAVDLGKVPTWATISFPCELLAQEKITPVVEPVGPTTTQDKPALEQDTPTTQDKVKPAEKISDIEWWSDDPLRGFCSAIVQDPSNYELKVRQSWDPVLDLFIDNYYNSYLSGEDTKSILASAMETDKTTAFLLAKKLGSDISYYIQNNQNKPKIPPLDAGVVLLVSWKKSSVLWELRRYVQKMKQLGLWSDLVAFTDCTIKIKYHVL